MTVGVSATGLKSSKVDSSGLCGTKMIVEVLEQSGTTACEV